MKSSLVNLPTHLAIIMDGNGRWAQRRGRPRSFGHRAGRDALKATVRRCAELEIPWLTVFAFSSENWSRPQSEVRLLMDLLRRALSQEVSELHENRIRIRFIGDLTAFSPEMRHLMADAECLTAANTRMMLNVAVNYGGRWDLVQAIKQISQDVRHGRVEIPDIDESCLQNYLSLVDMPSPDLLIRTGGEKRLSNFMLWELAYTELVFTDTLWPAFNADDLDDAIAEFQKRERRFGHTPEQLAPVRSA